MLVEIINLDPETGLQNILPVQEASLHCISKKHKHRTWTEVPSCLQIVKQTLVHSKQTDVLGHVTSYHHLLNQSLINTELWKQIIEYA